MEGVPARAARADTAAAVETRMEILRAPALAMRNRSRARDTCAWHSATASASAASAGSGFSVSPRTEATICCICCFEAAAETRNAGLDLARRITVRGNLCLRCGQQYHAAHFREAQRRFHVQSGENGFDRNRIRNELFHKL